MGKAMAIGGMVIAGLTTLIFGVDMVAGVPFQGASPIMDVGFLVSGLILGYLSWNAFRDVRP